MNNKASRLIVIILAVIFIGGAGLFCKVCPAQAQIGTKVSPVRIEIMADPGETIRRKVTITNVSSEENTFYVYLRDFRAEGESGKPFLIAPGSEEGYYLANWINITSEGIFLEPEEEATVIFSINVPSDIGPGGYYGAILFGTEPPKLQLDSEDKGAGMAVAQQTASLILMHVRGDVEEEAHIREFNTDKDFYATPFDVNFLIRIENSGNVHVKPIGAVSITNMFGKEVAVIRVNERGGNVLPGSIRRFTDTVWSGDTGFGRYKAALGLSYGTPASRGGQGKSSLVAAKHFWIIPWKIITPVGLGLIFSGALFFLLLRVYRNKAVQRAMEQAGLGRVGYVRKFQGPSPALHLGMILVVVFTALFFTVAGMYLFFFA